MDYENIMQAINDVNQRLECEFSTWNITDDSYIIEECIWIIKGLETKRNNLFIQAKKQNISIDAPFGISSIENQKL
ncbi:hypothetical protein CLHOM_29310 [Clostridium homopropionicum DSM 5847]|uniref:Uncharacterized protein n=1 Tax=Clostridium homopropionicum DSM 5847 TaxID=1121318 RepID=A0A0L6Z6Q3_9CLOT|nr:hypothetical protein [Clostridium homopropionicum]KOA18647.1 hypothetical protein CLHOM_29310 [Clostridium homopropionicum DSM 5847]SFG51286.1 hypothetical protein SAMN04488501_11068 [Clostridium homopropionicum]